MPDDGAVVVGEVGALAAAEALGPVQGALQAPVGLGGQHHPVGGGGERRLLQRGVGAAERDRRAPPVGSENLRGRLPVVGHQGQLAVHPVADDEPAVGRGGQPRQRGRHHVQPGRQRTGRLHQRVLLDADHPQRGAHLGQQLGRHAAPGLPHALGLVGVRAAGAQVGGPAAAVALHGDDVERAPQPPVGGRGQARVQRVVAAAGEPPDRAPAPHRHGVAALDVLGPGVGHAVGAEREGRVPHVAGPRRSPARSASTRRRSGARRSRTGRRRGPANTRAGSSRSRRPPG